MHQEKLVCYNGNLVATAATVDGEYGDGGVLMSRYDVDDESRNVRRIVTPDTLFFVGAYMLRMEDDGADKDKHEDDISLLLLLVELLMFLEQQWLCWFLSDTNQGFAYDIWWVDFRDICTE